MIRPGTQYVRGSAKRISWSFIQQFLIKTSLHVDHGIIIMENKVSGTLALIEGYRLVQEK